MRKLLFLLLIPFPSWATVAIVQTSTAVINNATSCTIPTGATGAGNLLVVGVAATSKPTGISDNAGTVNTYTDNTSSDATASGASASIWYKANSNAGGTSISVTGLSASSNGDCFFWEISGASVTSPVDVGNAKNNDTTGTTSNGAALTPNNSGDILISIYTDLGGAITAANSPWTGNHVPTGGKAQGGASLIPGNTNTQTPTYADTSGNTSCSTTVGFLPATTTVPPPPPTPGLYIY